MKKVERKVENMNNSSIINKKDSENVSSSVFYLSPECELINLKQKHKDELLKVVYRCEYISHAELAKALNLSPSGLNAVIKKICEDCNLKEKPLEYKKVNKFKYYRLTDFGKRYVEQKLISSEAKEYQEVLEGCWNIYQLRVKGNMEQETVLLLEKYVRLDEVCTENADLFFEFMNCLQGFYQKMPEEAMSALNKLVTDKAVKEKIKVHIIERHQDKIQIEPLNLMFREETEKVYDLVDEIIKYISNSGSHYQMSFCEIDNWQTWKPIIQKIEADMFQALMGLQSENKLRKLWISSGMDVHLAYYLAEKYRFLMLSYERGREQKL